VIVLTRERVSNGWSRAELARRAGLHPSTVGSIESGRLRAYPGQLAKIARALEWPEGRAASLLADESAPELHGGAMGCVDGVGSVDNTGPSSYCAPEDEQ